MLRIKIFSNKIFQIFHGNKQEPPSPPPVSCYIQLSRKWHRNYVEKYFSFLREILPQELPASPLPARMGGWELELWEQWWKPEFSSLCLSLTELARWPSAGLGAWRKRLPSSPKGAPCLERPTSRNVVDYRNPEIITQSFYAKLLQLLVEEFSFVTEVSGTILWIFLTTGKNRGTMINKRGFSINIFSFLCEFYVYLQSNQTSTHLSNFFSLPIYIHKIPCSASLLLWFCHFTSVWSISLTSFPWAESSLEKKELVFHKYILMSNEQFYSFSIAAGKCSEKLKITLFLSFLLTNF